MNFRIIALIIGSLFVVMMAWISFTQHRIGGYGVETDFYWDYAPAADNLTHLEIDLDRHRYRGPGYPLILAIMSSATGDSFTAGRIISLLAAIIVMVITWRLTKDLFGPGWGVWAIIALALNCTFIEYTFRVGTDMFFTALCALFFYLLTIEPKMRNVFLVGLIAGYAFLTRYNGAALVLVSIIWVVFSHSNRKKRLKRIGCFSAGLALTLLPWIVLLYFRTGNPFYNLNSMNIAYEVFGRGKVAWDQFWFVGEGEYPSGIFDLVISFPKELISTLLANFFHHFQMDMENLLKWSVGWLSLSGIVVYLYQGANPRRLRWIFLTYLTLFSILATVFYSNRFSLPILPIYLILALVFLSSDLMVENPSWWKLKIPAAGVIAAIMLLIGIPSTANSIAGRVSKGPIEIIQLSGEDVVKNLPVGRMAARKPHAPYILGHEFVVIPPIRDLDELAAFLDSSEVDYLFANASEALFRPPLFILLNKPDTVNTLSPVYHQTGVKPCGVWRRHR